MMELKPLSSAVQNSLNLAKETYNLILEFHPSGKYTPTPRSSIFYALADIVTEHFGAIIHLFRERQFFGSALALLRPLVESHLRAVWIDSVASDALVEKIARGKSRFPEFATCLEDVEAHLRDVGAEGVYKLDKATIAVLHGLTHSGLEQISNRFSPEMEVTPYGYSDAKLTALLDWAGQFAVMMAIVEIQAMEGKGPPAPKAKNLAERFDSLRHAYGG